MNKADRATMFERRIWVRVLRIVSVVFMEAFEKHSTAQHSTDTGLGIMD